MSDEKALVSVIIPLYNAEAHIAECVHSVQAQTWPNIEIIIVDNGSTDNSFSIAKAFGYPNLKIAQHLHKGAGAARNAGLKEATGKYIQFLDADDILSDNKIAEQVKLLEQRAGFIAVCDTVYFDDGTDHTKNPRVKEWYSYESNDPVNFLIKLYGGSLIGEKYGGMIQPNAWLTPASVIDSAGMWNENITTDDDGEFFCRVILNSRGVAYAPNAVNYYRKFTTNSNLSAQKNLEGCKSMLMVTDLKSKYMLEKTSDLKAKLALSRLYWENAFSFYPQYKTLSAEAEKKAKALSPGFRFSPFRSGLKKTLSAFAGWKFVKLLQFKLNY